MPTQMVLIEEIADQFVDLLHDKMFAETRVKGKLPIYKFEMEAFSKALVEVSTEIGLWYTLPELHDNTVFFTIGVPKSILAEGIEIDHPATQIVMTVG